MALKADDLENDKDIMILGSVTPIQILRPYPKGIMECGLILKTWTAVVAAVKVKKSPDIYKPSTTSQALLTHYRDYNLGIKSK